jgi:NAD(P)-dependent dehydrogenase (short-subunit alcohol dehydrogenase family)
MNSEIMKGKRIIVTGPTSGFGKEIAIQLAGFSLLAIACSGQRLRPDVGYLKPVEVAAPPTGVAGSSTILPLSAITFLLSLQPKPANKTNNTAI